MFFTFIQADLYVLFRVWAARAHWHIWRLER